MIITFSLQDWTKKRSSLQIFKKEKGETIRWGATAFSGYFLFVAFFPRLENHHKRRGKEVEPSKSCSLGQRFFHREEMKALSRCWVKTLKKKGDIL